MNNANHPLRDFLWQQLGGSIDMLENAIKSCNEENWNTGSRFWYICYHCLFYLDYYSDRNPAEFKPPRPFTLSEFDPSGKLPDRVYTPFELIEYCNYCRNKCQTVIGELSIKNAEDRFINDYRNYSFLEILIYNLRHVQHHVGQLQLLLRLNHDQVPNWVSETKLALRNKV